MTYKAMNNITITVSDGKTDLSRIVVIKEGNTEPIEIAAKELTERLLEVEK